MRTVVSSICRNAPVSCLRWLLPLIVWWMAIVSWPAAGGDVRDGCREGFSDYSNTIYACNIVISTPELATPELIRALQIRAQALVGSGQPGAAVRDYSSAIDRLPSGRLQGYILYLRGRTRLEHITESRVEGISDLERANTLAPANTRIREALASIYFQQGRYEKAIKHSSDVLASDPRSVIARKVRARALEQSGQSYLTLKDLDVLITGTPRDYDLIVWRARIHHTRNNLHAALADYRKAARIKSSDELLSLIVQIEQWLDD